MQDLADGSKTLKLGDFGLATMADKPLYAVCGTPTYIAPEVLAEVGLVNCTCLIIVTISALTVSDICKSRSYLPITVMIFIVFFSQQHHIRLLSISTANKSVL